MKLNKIFIVSLLLLAIIAMGAVSASEDISDDTITAIDPTDEAVSESVDEIEPADEIITQTVEEEPTEDATIQAVEEKPANEIITQTVEEEPNEEIIGESVDEIEIEKSNDSNEILTDGEEDFRIKINNYIYDSDTYVIMLTATCNKNGTVKYYVNDELQGKINVVDGMFKEPTGISAMKYLRIEDLHIINYGSYSINVTFTENVTEKVTVLGTSEIYYPDFDIELSESCSEFGDTFIYIYSKSVRNGTMNIYVNGKLKLNYTVEKGYMLTEYSREYDLDISLYRLIDTNGIYNITVTFKDKETGKVDSLAEGKRTIIIGMIKEFTDIGQNMGADEELILHINVPNIKSGNVAIYEYNNYVKGKKIASGNIINENATLTLTGLSPDNTTQLLIEYSTNIGKANTSLYVRAYKNVGNASLSAPSEVIEGNNPAITFNSEKPGKLYIVVDGQTLEFYDVSSLKYIIPDLAVGTHNIRVIFYGEYIGYNYTTGMSMYDVVFFKSFNITVKPKPVAPAKTKTTITASKVTAIYNSAAKTLSVTLKDAKDKVVAGKSITVALNGKTYKATTNANGIAKFKIPTKLVPKTYTATIKFAGDSKYIASSGSAKVLVKKAKVKIKAAKKTFKVKAKTKKVKATLKDNKGKVMKKVKLTLKIGKKTYKAKTNKKGIATFKVKLAKKGKYTAKVKFAGNKYFKAATKKIKIKVKK